MEQRLLHAKGPLFSRIVAGAWRWHTVSPEQVEKLVHTALNNRITTFDHADIYGDHSNEEVFGRVLKQNPGLRQKMQLVTKCGIKFPSPKRPATRVKHYDTTKAHILWSAENSLQMLGTDVIDLLLIHRPDPLMNPDEIAEAFTELRKSGKVLHVGVSNFTQSQFRLLQSRLPFPLVTNQVEISFSRLDPFFNGDLDTMMEFRIAPMAWSPLSGGKAGPITEGDVAALTKKYNCSFSQLSLAWLMKHPSSIFPVIGTTKADRIEEAAHATSIDLDRQDWFEMLKVVMKKEMP